MSYDLEYEKRIDYSKRASYKRRNEYANYYQKGNIRRQKVCVCCGRKDNIELHHIIPIYLGGHDVYYNLIYWCHDCHVLMDRMLKERFESINEDNLLSNKKENYYERYGNEL